MSYCDTCSISKCPVDKTGHGLITFCGHKKSAHKKPVILDPSQSKLFDLEEGD